MDRKVLKHFVVHYNQEIRPGQEVHTELRCTEDQFSYTGSVDGVCHFDMGGTLADR